MQELTPMTDSCNDLLHEEELGYVKDLVLGQFQEIYRSMPRCSRR